MAHAPRHKSTSYSARSNAAEPHRRPRRRKKSVAHPIADVLIATLKKAGLTEQAKRLRIHQAWTSAVGRDIAERTEPFGFSRGVLTVKSANSAWQNELTFLKADIIAKLNAFFGEDIVYDLRVIGGVVRGPSDQPRRMTVPKKPGATRPNREDVAFAKKAGESIEDDEIRRAFERMMGKALVVSRMHRGRE